MKPFLTRHKYHSIIFFHSSQNCKFIIFPSFHSITFYFNSFQRSKGPCIFLSSLHHPGGHVHAVDSCLDLIYVYVYASLICRSPDNVCPRPCQKLINHLSHHSSLCFLALGVICYTVFCHDSCTSLWHNLKCPKHDLYTVYPLMYTTHIHPLTLFGKCFELSLKK